MILLWSRPYVAYYCISNVVKLFYVQVLQYGNDEICLLRTRNRRRHLDFRTTIETKTMLLLMKRSYIKGWFYMYYLSKLTQNCGFFAVVSCWSKMLDFFENALSMQLRPLLGLFDCYKTLIQAIKYPGEYHILYKIWHTVRYPYVIVSSIMALNCL